MINTKTVRRRLVAFSSLGDVTKDLDRLEAAHRAGTLKKLGNHEPGAIFLHLADAMRCSFDGFPARSPLAMRLLCRLIKRRVLSQPFKPGLKLGAKTDQRVWNDSTSFDDGLAALRTQIARASSPGDTPSQPHPFFEFMTREEWNTYYLRHAELHLSFLQP